MFWHVYPLIVISDCYVPVQSTTIIFNFPKIWLKLVSEVPLAKKSLDFQVVLESVPIAFLWICLSLTPVTWPHRVCWSYKAKVKGMGSFSWYNQFLMSNILYTWKLHDWQFKNIFPHTKSISRWRFSILSLFNKIKTFMLQKSLSYIIKILIDKYDNVKTSNT